MDEKIKSYAPVAVSVLALALALYAVLFVPAGQAAPASARDATFDRIVKSGEMTVCYIPWPPSVIKDPGTGKVSGFIIDIFGKIAFDANLKVNYVESTWGGIPADLNSGRCDAGVAGIYPLISRSTSVAFTRPFLYSGETVAARAGDNRFKSVDDFNKKGVKIAVIQGEYGYIYAQKYLPNAELVVLDKSADFTMPIITVSSGQADLGITESDVMGEYAKSHPEVKDLYPNQPFATVPTSFAVRKDDQQLLNFLDNGLTYLSSTGFIEASAKKYNATYWYEQDIGYVDIGKKGSG